MTLIERIDAALEVATGEDRDVLRYVRSQITPEGIEKRPDEDKNVSHLQEVARARLKNYETRNGNEDE